MGFGSSTPDIEKQAWDEFWSLISNPKICFMVYKTTTIANTFMKKYEVSL